MSETKMKGSITISRPRGGNGPERIELRLTDETSGTTFVETQIELAHFTEALFGLSNVPCLFELRAERVGMRREHKDEIVPCGNTYAAYGREREKIAAKALAPFEVDGWKGRADDLFNHHRRTQNGARVTFVRYVNAEGPK